MWKEEVIFHRVISAIQFYELTLKTNGKFDVVMTTLGDFHCLDRQLDLVPFHWVLNQ